MDPIYWAVLLLLLSVLLVGVDMFIPSHGIITGVAVAAAIGAIGMAFYHRGMAVGSWFILAALVLLPSSLGLMIKIWPRTPLGRRVLLDVPAGEDVLPADDPRRFLPQLVGKLGQAQSMMLPGGTVEVEGQTYEAVSDGMPIEEGDAVRVVQVRHSRLIVHKI